MYLIKGTYIELIKTTQQQTSKQTKQIKIKAQIYWQQWT
jgi:hypothetical protein